MTFTKICTTLLITAAAALTAQAGQPVVETDHKSKVVMEDEFPYKQGTKELEINVGVFPSVGTKGDVERPDAGYALAEFRLGYMLTTASGSGIFRGNLEFLGEVFGGGIYDGPGSYLAGLDIFLRYNFVQPNAKLVPFIQIGGGGVYSDAADEDAQQRLIGSDLSFNLESEIGFRYHFRKDLALTLGAEYRHISNADTASRNRGLNAIGGVIGVSWFF